MKGPEMSKGNLSAGRRSVASSTSAKDRPGTSAPKRPSRVRPVDAPFFTCPPEHYGPGTVSGVRAAAELLRRALDPARTETRHFRVLDVRNTMRDAGLAMLPDAGKTSSHAAHAFMGIMAELVFFAAERVDIEQLLRDRLAHAEATATRWAQIVRAD